MWGGGVKGQGKRRGWLAFDGGPNENSNIFRFHNLNFLLCTQNLRF
jgi:hypothetical protein